MLLRDHAVGPVDVSVSKYLESEKAGKKTTWSELSAMFAGQDQI